VLVAAIDPVVGEDLTLPVRGVRPLGRPSQRDIPLHERLSGRAANEGLPVRLFKQPSPSVATSPPKYCDAVSTPENSSRRVNRADDMLHVRVMHAARSAVKVVLKNPGLPRVLAGAEGSQDQQGALPGVFVCHPTCARRRCTTTPVESPRRRCSQESCSTGPEPSPLSGLAEDQNQLKRAVLDLIQQLNIVRLEFKWRVPCSRRRLDNNVLNRRQLSGRRGLPPTRRRRHRLAAGKLASENTNNVAR